MNDVVVIEGTEIQAKFYNGQRVVTFKDIDAVHQRPDGTARNAFKRNKKHLIENEDYVVINPNVRKTYIRNINVPNRGITVFTESGYLMLVKAFNDDLAWKVQRELVNSYFREKDEKNVFNPPIESFREERPKIEYHTSSTPVPKNPSWQKRNKRRVTSLCERANKSIASLYHLILTRIGEEYDLDAANEIYEKELGHPPKYAMDIVSYFPELGRMADDILDILENEMRRKTQR